MLKDLRDVAVGCGAGFSPDVAEPRADGPGVQARRLRDPLPGHGPLRPIAHDPDPLGRPHGRRHPALLREHAQGPGGALRRRRPPHHDLHPGGGLPHGDRVRGEGGRAPGDGEGPHLRGRQGSGRPAPGLPHCLEGPALRAALRPRGRRHLLVPPARPRHQLLPGPQAARVLDAPSPSPASSSRGSPRSCSGWSAAGSWPCRSCSSRA